MKCDFCLQMILSFFILNLNFINFNASVYMFFVFILDKYAHVSTCIWIWKVAIMMFSALKPI